MKRIVIAGLIAFLLLLLVTFPARVAYNWFVPAEVKLSGISGSVWQGAATEGIAGGAYIRNLQWQFRPAGLFRGQLAFAASGSPGSGMLHADIAVGFGGALRISNLNGNVPLDVVHEAFQRGGIRGDVILQFETLTIQNGLPVAADGSVTVADFLAPALSAERVGDFRADFQTTANGISGVVQDVSGVLDVEGTIELTADRNYVFIGQVAPTAETPPSINNQLRFLGSPDERGQRQFRFEGQL